jgi:hypothetical protein
VDSYSYYICQKEISPTLIRKAEKKSESQSAPDVPSSDGQVVDHEVIELKNKEKERNEDLTPLSDDECILANPRVRGFDLKAKEWCTHMKFIQLEDYILMAITGEFNVDEVQPPDWNERPYEKLVLPPGEKELITAFAERDRDSESGFDDFVQHKGRVCWRHALGAIIS